MKPAIALIDSVLVLKGNRVLADMERCSREPDKANEALLMKILRENANTEYGKKYGFADIHSVEEYRKRVPYSDYDVYAPYIQRMVKNKETNLITAYNVIQYAETSGSVGVQKKIPVTDRSMAVYEKYSFARTKAIASRYYHEHYHRPVPFEKGLNTLETETTVMDDGTPRGSVTGSVSRRFRKLFPLFLTSPHPVLRSHTHDTGHNGTGYPELSFHGTQPWNIDLNGPGLCFASLWAEDHVRFGTEEDAFLYVAANAHWEEHRFTLPLLPPGYRWHLAFEAWGFSCEPGEEKRWEESGITLAPRSTAVLVGRMGKP